MFYFQTNALGFTPEFLGRVRLAGSLASLAGKSPISLPSFLPSLSLRGLCDPEQGRPHQQCIAATLMRR